MYDKFLQNSPICFKLNLVVNYRFSGTEKYFPTKTLHLDSHLLPTSEHGSYYRQGALSKKGELHQ